MPKKEQKQTLMDILHDVAKEHGIDEYEFLDKLETALAPKFVRVLGLINDCRVTLNTEDGTPYVYELVPVGDIDPETGEAESYEEVDVTPKDKSRIVALEAKNIVNQMIREARREKIVEEYVGRIGECVTGEVQHIGKGFTIIKLRENLEAELPAKEQPANERYSHNERLKVYIVDARRAKGSDYSIIVSRRHPGLVKRLFEIEVPEVYDGIVEIKAIARDAGARSKVAVYSKEAGLDPVGACVGPKGNRVRQVVQDLRNERIDIIPWSKDSATYIKSALSPAKVERVLINEDTHTATVIVNNDQLSLAIGKEGQNARLAAQLTGWRIDIKSTEMAAGAGLIDDAPIAAAGMMDDLSQIDTRCIAVNAEGVRCRNHARPGSQYCGLHDKEGAEA